MKKSKVLSVVMSSALVASLAATAAMSVSAAGITASSQIPSHTVGVVGSFNGWSDDIALTDEDGDGIYEGIVEVAEVTEEMFTGWKVDDEPTGEDYLQFKVRLDGAWDDSWGAYEPLNDRTYNSQSNVPVKEAVAGEPVSFKVFFDIKNPDPAAVEEAKAHPDDHYAEEGDDEYNYLHVWYEIVKAEEPSVEESSEEPSVAESSVESTVESSTETVTSTVSETPATETSADTTTVPTGDTTSAAALAAVVIASLGTAVVMTKKASSKN